MNSQIKELITPNNILSYSNACISVCKSLIDLKDENFKKLIIPSRGAYPFYRGAISSLHFLTDSINEVMNFNANFNISLLPFTSDWGQAKIATNSKSVRKFWTKVLADLIRQESSPYSLFYNNLVDEVGLKYTINTSKLKVQFKDSISENEKFVFIDTAISGKAICDIIESFSEFNLRDYYVILIVDSSGKKLKPEYKSIIEREKQQGRLIQVNVKKIFSEDASPLLNSGISSLVFPSLIERAYFEVPEFKNNEFVGAGLWFIDSISHLRKSNPILNGVRGTISSLIHLGLCINFDQNVQWFEELVEEETNQMIDSLNDINLFDGQSTKSIIYDRIRSQKGQLEEQVDVTGSHIIRIDFTNDYISQLLKPVTNL